MPDAIFSPDADRFVPSELARGPWDPGAQHGGAPAGLLARCLEAMNGGEDMVVVRVGLEFLRPVPLEPIRVTTSVLRPGRKAQILEGSMWAGEREVARGRALRLRCGDGAPGSLPPAAPAHRPEDARAVPFPVPDAPVMFNGDGVEVRFARGSWEPGPALAWLRLRVPIVVGEAPSPLVRAAAAADFGNGVASVLDWTTHSFVNPDLTLYLERPPQGEWIGLEAATHLGSAGTAVAESVVLDERGRVGRAVQSLLVERR